MKNKITPKASAFKKTLALAALIITTVLTGSLVARAQETLQATDGKPFNANATADVNGSVDFKLDWADGTLTRKGGKQYTNLKLKYDVYDDQVVFEDVKSGNSFVPTFTDITGFTLKGLDGDKTEMIFANGFPAVDNQTPASFYQVIAGGKTQLLKRFSKNIKESQGFGDGTTTKAFEDTETDYILKNGTMTKVKADEKDITTALSDKAPQLTAYAKTNHLGFKKDEDLAKIFDYYNTL